MIVIPLVFLCRNATENAKFVRLAKSLHNQSLRIKKNIPKNKRRFHVFFINIKIFSNWASISINFAYNKSKDTKYKILRKELKTK